MRKQELIFSVTIKDCMVDTFRSGGPGGQHQNKTESAVRVTHQPSGAVGESREMKSQYANKQRAFKRMAESDKFQRWARIETARRSGQPSIEQQVKSALAPNNLRLEIHDDKSRWVESKAMLPTETEINNLFESHE